MRLPRLRECLSQVVHRVLLQVEVLLHGRQRVAVALNDFGLDSNPVLLCGRLQHLLVELVGIVTDQRDRLAIVDFLQVSFKAFYSGRSRNSGLEMTIERLAGGRMDSPDLSEAVPVLELCVDVKKDGVLFRHFCSFHFFSFFNFSALKEKSN